MWSQKHFLLLPDFPGDYWGSCGSWVHLTDIHKGLLHARLLRCDLDQVRCLSVPQFPHLPNAVTTVC